MKLRGKQVALYIDNDTHTKAIKEAKSLNISFSQYISLLINTKGLQIKLKDVK